MEKEQNKNKKSRTSTTSKKNATKKTQPKKITNKKTTKVSTKKTVTKKEPIEQQKQTTASNKISYLYLAFVALLAIVVFLGVKVYQTSKIKRVEEANVVVPLLKKDSSYNMSINLEELKKNKEYSIKISNFRQNTVNQEEVDYQILVSNESKAIIKVTKDQDENNLIKNQESTRIEGVSLKAKEKNYSIYHFSVIENKDKIKSNDKIDVTIKS